VPAHNNLNGMKLAGEVPLSHFRLINCMLHTLMGDWWVHHENYSAARLYIHEIFDQHSVCKRLTSTT